MVTICSRSCQTEYEYGVLVHVLTCIRPTVLVPVQYVHSGVQKMSEELTGIKVFLMTGESVKAFPGFPVTWRIPVSIPSTEYEYGILVLKADRSSILTRTVD
jgi:hypothetical protein